MKVETLQSIVNNDVTPFAEMLEEVILLAKKTKTFTGKTVNRPKGAFLTVVRGNFFMRISVGDTSRLNTSEPVEINVNVIADKETAIMIGQGKFVTFEVMTDCPWVDQVVLFFVCVQLKIMPAQRAAILIGETEDRRKIDLYEELSSLKYKIS